MFSKLDAPYPAPVSFPACRKPAHSEKAKNLPIIPRYWIPRSDGPWLHHRDDGHFVEWRRLPFRWYYWHWLKEFCTWPDMDIPLISLRAG